MPRRTLQLVDALPEQARLLAGCRRRESDTVGHHDCGPLGLPDGVHDRHACRRRRRGDPRYARRPRAGVEGSVDAGHRCVLLGNWGSRIRWPSDRRLRPDGASVATGETPIDEARAGDSAADLWGFGDSLVYDAIEIADGSAGILSISGRAFTMGFTIYLPSYSEQTLVHECVHTWQFQFAGFRYIGNSALNQLDSVVFNRDYDPYEWRRAIDAGDSWFTLRSAEAQAKFVEDVWALGSFDFTDPEVTDPVGSGAFFREDESGHNAFVMAGVAYTAQANAAWRILRTS